jgi:Xylose isomerase-like TIM barrel
MQKENAKADIRLGTTLYSLTNEYHSRRYDFAALIREVAKRKLGPGLEVVGFQSFRNFPQVSAADADQFKALVEETGLELTCLGMNADRWIDRDREMTPDESYQYQLVQVETAAKLGFPLVRFQWGAGPEVIERLAPTAERLNVKLALEIHAPHHVQHPEVLAYREMYERVGSPFLGFIPDFGASAKTVPEAYLKYFRWRGIPQEVISAALDIWHEAGDPFARRVKFIELGERHHWDKVGVIELSIIFGLFSRQPASAWMEIMPRTYHVHGKFYSIGEDGLDPAIPYEDILPVFVKGGYRGYISSEWEGHQVSDDDGFEALTRHHALERRLLGL